MEDCFRRRSMILFRPRSKLTIRNQRAHPISTLNYILLRVFLVICAILPLRLLHGIGAVWGRLVYWLPNRSRETTYRNLVACFPEKSPAQLDALVLQSLQHTACTALEMGKSWLSPMDKVLGLVKDTEGMAAFEEAVSAGKGLILLAPHHSNWEVFGYYTATKLDSIFMYQPPKFPAMDTLLKQTRSRGGIDLAPANRQGVASLLKTLQRGGLVGILPDQVPNDNGGLYAPFFGNQALTMTLVSKLLSRHQVPVFCGFAERLPAGKGFRVIMQKAHPAIYSADLAESVAGLNQSVEACVLRAVAQYQWEYKRFRRQPDGSNFYR